MSKRSNLIIMTIFLVYIFGLGILHLIIPDKSFSENENRTLQELPKFSWEELKNGRFTEKFEEYVQDQFPFKNEFVALKSDMERLRLKGENNNVYFGENDRLLEKFEKPGEAMQKNLDGIESFIGSMDNVNAYVMIVPTATKVYEDELPKYTMNYDQLDIIEKAKEQFPDGTVIDVYDALIDKNDEYIYFKTDHHWTMRGAYYAYLEAAKSMGFEPVEIGDFTTKVVSDDFEGTFYSKANNTRIPSDSIEIFEPNFETNYEIYYDQGKDKHTSVFEFEHLEKKDKYSIFMDGNHALVEIKTGVENGKKLAVVKDSYSHCFIPFLANHYEEIYVIDLRYFNINLNDYINALGIEDVLFLYNAKSIAEDPNIKNLYRE